MPPDLVLGVIFAGVWLGGAGSGWALRSLWAAAERAVLQSDLDRQCDRIRWLLAERTGLVAAKAQLEALADDLATGRPVAAPGATALHHFLETMEEDTHAP